MVIAVNTRFLLKDQLEGIGWFTYETLKRISQNHPEHQFIFLFDRNFDEHFIFSDNVEGIKVWPPARHPFLWYYWFEIAIPKTLRNKNVDLFLSPDGFTSIALKTKKITVIHDLAFEHFPAYIPPKARAFYKRNTPLYAKNSNRIATVSNFSKKDIENNYKIPADKIDVVYNGISSVYKPLAQGEKKAVQMRESQGAPYFLFVSSLHPRKNPLGLLQAFDQFKEKTKTPVQLLLAGRKAWDNNDMERFYNSMKHKNAVKFIGHCDQKKLAEVLGGALALVYPSFFEGFGIPLIDAMKCEVPVITSNNSSMKEIAEGIGLLVDPSEPSSIAHAMEKIYLDNDLRTQLIRKGTEKARSFSWDKTAQALWESMEQLL